VKFLDRELRAAILVESEKVDDLLRVLAEDELVAARQYRNGTQAELLQLGKAAGILKNIHGYEVDPTDR
jgi:hypothetical protein